jgi:hypothetical protein
MKTTAVFTVMIALLAVASCSKTPEQPAASAPTPVAAPETQLGAAAAPSLATPPPQTAALTESIADIPDYPGATQALFGAKSKAEHGFTKRIQVRFNCPGTLAKSWPSTQRRYPRRAGPSSGCRTSPTKRSGSSPERAPKRRSKSRRRPGRPSWPKSSAPIGSPVWRYARRST